MSEAGAQVEPSWLPRSRPARLALAGAAVLVLLVAFAVYLMPRPRTFAIDAHSRSVTLRFTGGEAMNAWLLPDVLVCNRRETRGSSSTAAAVPPEDAELCDPRLYDVTRPGDVEMTWSEGAEVVVLRAGSGPLEIFVRETGAPATRSGDAILARSSRLVVREDDARDGLVLGFAARIVIGEVPGPGSQGTLADGVYEVREPMPTQQRPQPVMTGDLFSGDQVRMVREGSDEDVLAFGFLVPETAEPGLRVVAYSPPGDLALRVDRFAAEPNFVAPTWIDRVLKDPILVALTTLAGTIGAVAVVLNNIAQLARWSTAKPARNVVAETQAAEAEPPAPPPAG